MKNFTTIVFLFVSFQLAAQNSFKGVINSEQENPVPISGVTILLEGTALSTISDSLGYFELINIPDGDQTLVFSYLGYEQQELQFTFPISDDSVIHEISLKSEGIEMDEVIVATTRNYQRPEYISTRVEVIEEEEVEERSHDKPSNVSHILREQPGIQVQRTSSTNGALNIRLQGLRGRYVQILKDGFPLFAGFSNVLGITQIPPLDLKQIEIIKGPSSTLYGGDAIAGVINLISKTPTEQPVYDVMFNGESAFAFDGGLYAAQKFKWFSFSLTGAYRYQKEKDWSGGGFSETPRLNRYHLAPQFYFDLSKRAKLNVGVSYTTEDRLGGSMAALKGESDSSNYYLEDNRSSRISTNLRFEYDFQKNRVLTVKNSFHLFNRELKLPWFLFKGRQSASASEINYRFSKGKNDLVFGADFRTDIFSDKTDSSFVNHDYRYLTGGAFIQYTHHFNEKNTLEAGLRFDYNNIYKLYALPHIAVLRHWNKIFSTRLNVGMGYKLPTIFQDETEEVRFMNIARITSATKPELSLGGIVDLQIKIPTVKNWKISIHQLYFFTHIFRPMFADTTQVVCPEGECEGIAYRNATGFIQTIGVETGFDVGYKGINVSLVYTLTDNHRNIKRVRSISPLTSKHIVYMLAGYEAHNFFIGIDCYYFSPVKLSEGGKGRGIWEFGINTQYAFPFLILFANFENVFNIRQTSYGQVVFPNPDYAHPRFSEIYAPLEGRLINVGFKLKIGSFLKNGSSNGGVERLRNKNND